VRSSGVRKWVKAFRKAKDLDPSSGEHPVRSSGVRKWVKAFRKAKDLDPSSGEHP
jgi:hypothetical protein